MKRRLRLVIDSNVVISGLLWGGKPGLLLGHAGESEISLHTSHVLLNELQATLARPKLARAVGATGRTPAELVVDYRRLCTLTRPRPLPAPISRDPDDDHVIACALAARVDIIVTGDDDLLVLGSVEQIRIMAPAAALAELN